ncbi:hypothetical protein HMPREF3213_00478 [Heyndrickxia coagulans]|uniref:Uncharacterized protein n=1 Tax=Heyndrickxia coagulans TaxID=1398 RepID=A0A133L0F3_HEYCO|nr:hypothetical protein HMPREF3213_00478 [Heyndrickxia coagulans]
MHARTLWGTSTGQAFAGTEKKPPNRPARLWAKEERCTPEKLRGARLRQEGTHWPAFQHKLFNNYMKNQDLYV